MLVAPSSREEHERLHRELVAQEVLALVHPDAPDSHNIVPGKSPSTAR
jgi:hypothetical protein